MQTAKKSNKTAAVVFYFFSLLPPNRKQITHTKYPNAVIPRLYSHIKLMGPHAAQAVLRVGTAAIRANVVGVTCVSVAAAVAK